jgi:hypothetical protein
MTTEPRVLLDGVQGEYVYRVQPCCRVEQRDNLLYGNIQKAYLKRKYVGRPEERMLDVFPTWSEETIAVNVNAYWAGRSAAPNWEYLTCRAVVVELVG